MTTQISKFITHSGSFHADDLFAYSVLLELFPRAELIRTRDADLIQNAGTNTIIFDVGNEYDPSRLRFDHHQIDKSLREEGLAYSSFGLIWKHFGLSYVQSTTQLSHDDALEVVNMIDQQLVRDIDAFDNGTLLPGQEYLTYPSTIMSLLGDFNPDFDSDDPTDADRSFFGASVIAACILLQRVKAVAASLRSEKIVRKAIEDRVHKQWIELPRGMDYQSTVAATGDEDILFIIYPTDNGWYLNVMNVSETSFEARCSLPSEWGGLRDADLAEKTGVQDAVFCHTKLFVAVAGSRDGILEMLSQALPDSTHT